MKSSFHRRISFLPSLLNHLRLLTPETPLILTTTTSLSESEFLYDWRFTAIQFVLATSSLRLTTSNLIFQLNICVYRPILSCERMGLSFTIAAGSRQRSHSQVRVSRDSLPYFTVSYSRLPQPEGPGQRIYVAQEQGCLVIPPGTGFPFRRLLRLAELWRHSTPPPHGQLTRCCKLFCL
jgi:hypothetical protein